MKPRGIPAVAVSLWLILAWPGDLPPVRAAADNLPLLTTARQVRQLSEQEVNRGYPVRLEGVVTFYDPEWALFFVQDETDGIYLYAQGREFAVREGQSVRVEGRSQSGTFTPIIVRPQVTVLGPGALPRVERPLPSDAIPARFDCQWITLEGWVRQATQDSQRLTLQVVASGRRWTVFVLKRGRAVADASRWVDARVRAVGVAGVAAVDVRQRPVRFNLYASGLEQITVLKAAPANPFGGPVIPIAALARQPPDTEQTHRLHVRGVVTLEQAGPYLTIQDATGPLRVERPPGLRARVGELVEVLGTMTPGQFGSSLQDTTVRSAGPGAPPAAVRVSAGKVLLGHYENQLVQVEGTLMDRPADATGHALILQSEGLAFAARLEGTNAAPRLPTAASGSRLSVTGICWVQRDPLGAPQFFQILLRSPGDVTIVRARRFYTLPQVLQALGVIAALGVLGLAWVVALRRRVRQQTRIIAQRLEQEAALEKRYQDLVETASDIIYTLDPEGRFTSINQAGEQLTGYTRAEALGMKLEQIVAPEYLEVIENSLQRQKAGQPPQPYEIEVVGKGGERHVLEVRERLVPEGGQPVRVQGIARNITERRRLEQQLAKLGFLKLRLLSPGGLQEKLRWITAGAVEIFGADFARIWLIAPADLCHRGCPHAAAAGRCACPPPPHCLHLEASAGRYTGLEGNRRRVPLGYYEVGQIARGIVEKMITNDLTQGLEGCDQAWAKSLGLGAFAGFPLRGKNGLPVGVLALFSRRAICPGEENLLADLAHTASHAVWAGIEAEKGLELAAIVECSEDAIMRANLEGIVTHWNRGAELLYGYSAAEMIGQSITCVMPPDRQDEVGKFMELTRRGERLEHYETLRRRKDGRLIHISLALSPIRDADNQIIAVSAIARDISERKAAEQERETLIEELQEALARVRTLSGLLPICSNCKKIRDDQGYWKQIESYIAAHSEARFTHGICPDCTKKLFPGLTDEEVDGDASG